MIRKKTLLVNNLNLKGTPLLRGLNQFEEFKLLEPIVSSRNFTRNCIESVNQLGGGTTKIFLPEVDTIVFRFLDQGTDNLFTKILESGFSSPLIEWFSACEKQNTPYVSPESNDILMRRRPYVSKKDKNVVYKHFYLGEGGFIIFQEINRLDPVFFERLLDVTLEYPWLFCYEFHLSVDYDKDLMPNVVQNLIYGHYITSGAKPRFFGTVDSTETSELLTRRGDKFQVNKQRKIEAHTIYFGNRYSSPVVIVFYNKKHEQRVTKQDYCFLETRVEVRIYNRQNDPDFIDTVGPCVIEYNTNSRLAMRTYSFVELLTQNLQFTTKYDTTRAHIDNVAPWFLNLLVYPFSCIFDIIAKYDTDLFIENKPTAEHVKVISDSNPSNRKRGRPKGSKDSKPRKRKTGKKRTKMEIFESQIVNYPTEANMSLEVPLNRV